MTLGRLHVIQAKKQINTASVILFHGSGDTGEGFLNWIKFLVEDFALPHVKFLFPTAPLQPYTPLNSELSNVWFDREAINPAVSENMSSIESIKPDIKNLLSNEVKAGISLNRIIVGGFSMGGTLALHTAYRFEQNLAGVFTMSSFLSYNSDIYKSLKDSPSTTPLSMWHGDRDTLVPIEWGQETYKRLVKHGVKVEFHPLKNTLHELKKDEILGVLEWIKNLLPDN